MDVNIKSSSKKLTVFENDTNHIKKTTNEKINGVWINDNKKIAALIYLLDSNGCAAHALKKNLAGFL